MAVPLSYPVSFVTFGACMGIYCGSDHLHRKNIPTSLALTLMTLQMSFLCHVYQHHLCLLYCHHFYALISLIYHLFRFFSVVHVALTVYEHLQDLWGID